MTAAPHKQPTPPAIPQPADPTPVPRSRPEKQSIKPTVPADMSKYDRLKLIKLMKDDYDVDEIAAHLVMNRRALIKFASRYSIDLGRSGGTRRIGAYVSRRDFHMIVRLADEAGISRSTMVQRLVKAVCEDEAAAKRLLGKMALPVRDYRRGR